MDTRCATMLQNTTDVDELCEQVCRGLKQARTHAGILIPRFATLEVQIQDGQVVQLEVLARFRPPQVK